MMNPIVAFFTGAIWMMFRQHEGDKGVHYTVEGPDAGVGEPFRAYVNLTMASGTKLRVTVEELPAK